MVFHLGRFRRLLVTHRRAVGDRLAAGELEEVGKARVGEEGRPESRTAREEELAARLAADVVERRRERSGDGRRWRRRRRRGALSVSVPADGGRAHGRRIGSGGPLRCRRTQSNRIHIRSVEHQLPLFQDSCNNSIMKSNCLPELLKEYSVWTTRLEASNRLFE